MMDLMYLIYKYTGCPREVTSQRCPITIFLDSNHFPALPTCQIKQLGQWPLASSYDVLLIPLVSGLNMQGSVVKLAIINMQ